MRPVGQEIYLRRLEKGMTQLELVRKTGIPQPNLSKIEKGKQDLTLSTLLKICEALEVRPGKLLEEALAGRAAKPLAFTRPVVERLARAVVHGKLRLKGEEKIIAGHLAKIYPGLRSRHLPAKEIHTAWFELRHRLNPSEIQMLAQRIRDEIARSR